MAELREHVADILMVLANVSDGDYERRVIKNLPADHPMMRLTEGINEMISYLAAEQAQNDAYKRELEDKLVTIEHQRAAIEELSTPIIEVWEGVLCLPVVGVLDTTRSAKMTDSLLTAIVEKKAQCAIIDITGIQVMDTATADHFLRMARAIRLLGAESFLTGINPSIAITMQTMGVNMNELATARSLRMALTQFLERRRSPSDGEDVSKRVTAEAS